MKSASSRCNLLNHGLWVSQNASHTSVTRVYDSLCMDSRTLLADMHCGGAGQREGQTAERTLRACGLSRRGQPCTLKTACHCTFSVSAVS